MWSFLNSRFEEVLGAMLLAIMACISFINVIVRYCTNFSFSSSEELTVNFFVWIVLLGTSRAFREGGNFCMSLVFDQFPRPIRKLLTGFSLICSIAFFIVLFRYGLLEVQDEIALSVVSESLAIPVWLYTIITPFCSLLIILRILQKFHDDLKNGNI